MKKTAGIAVGIIGLLFIIWGIIMKIRGYMAVSIIGGADGPTSVFVAGKLGGNWFHFLIVLGIILAAIAVIIFFRKKR